MSEIPRHLSDISTDIGLSFPYVQALKGAFYVPPREATIVPIPEHLHTGPVGAWLSRDPLFKNGIYSHQALALEHLHAGQNVWVGTSTGSGKSFIANAHTVYALSQNPDARFFRFYPAKALQSDQRHELQRALTSSGLLRSEDDIGIINGDEKDEKIRLKVLEDSRIVFITPDVLHRWLMGNLAKPEVHNFLVNLKQIFLDESHVYTGLFGRNTSYLLKRLQYAVDTKKRQISFERRRMPEPVQLFAASATMVNAGKTLYELTGQKFFEVGREHDGSSKHRQDVTWYAVDPEDEIGVTKRFIVDNLKAGKDALPGMGISFLYNRQTVERMAAELNHELGQQAVFSFRSGYTNAERDDLLMKVNFNQCEWLVCTPVAELGLHIKSAVVGTSTGRLMNPFSLTQQIGRVGREDDAAFHVFAPPRTFGPDNSPTSLRAYAQGEMVKNDLLPPIDRIVSYHVVCLANEMRQMGLLPETSLREGRYAWGPEFNEMMQRHVNGDDILDSDMSNRLRAMRRRSDVHGLLGLRDFELGLPLTLRQTMEDGTEKTIGTLTRQQAVREAYPGARFLHRGTFLKVEEWGKEEGSPNRIIYLVPSPDHALTIRIPEKFINLGEKIKPMEGSISVMNAAGRIMEVPFGITEETIGYYIKNRGDGGTGNRHMYYSETDSGDENGASRRTYRHFSDTSGILIDFRKERLNADEMKLAAEVIRDRYCEMTGIPYSAIEISSSRIYQTVRGKQQEIPYAIVIHDRGSNKLRFTTDLIAKLPEIIESMADERALKVIHQKLARFYSEVTANTRKMAPLGKPEPSVQEDPPSDEDSGAIYRLHQTVWFNGAFESSERRRRGLSGGPTRVSIEEVKVENNQTLYRIVPWDDPTAPKVAIPRTAKVERWVPSTRLSIYRPNSETRGSPTRPAHHRGPEPSVGLAAEM